MKQLNKKRIQLLQPEITSQRLRKSTNHPSSSGDDRGPFCHLQTSNNINTHTLFQLAAHLIRTLFRYGSF
jgi:hypothetical protein